MGEAIYGYLIKESSDMLVENPGLTISPCEVLNPATLLPTPKGSLPFHACLETLVGRHPGATFAVCLWAVGPWTTYPVQSVCSEVGFKLSWSRPSMGKQG